MADSSLIVKSKAFALDVIQVCKELRVAKCESALINQFLRSGTEHRREYQRSILCSRQG